MADGQKIVFEHLGIAKAISNHTLRVPINQRAYAWEEEHVRDLLQDLTAAFGKGEYFLGTIVLTGSDPALPEVADGQQRLATITIVLAAIRDYLFSVNDKQRAESIEREFLLRIDRTTTEIRPYLTLNTVDNDYFRKRILARPDDDARRIAPETQSHTHIEQAATMARDHVATIVAPLSQQEGVTRLIEWTNYLERDASVILVTVPGYLNAFRIFETLNDRGLALSQADLLKNFLLDKAADRIDEAHERWMSMEGSIETINGGSHVVTYIRHLFITMHGHTRERDLYDRIAETIKTKQNAIDFANSLAQHAPDYVALLNPGHQKWNEYGTNTRRHIYTIHRHLQVEQIRPLMLAVVRKFSVHEAKRALRMMVCWSVRFLISGGRGGLLDKRYADHAHQVGKGTITSAQGLYTSMRDVVPSDAQFSSAFQTARVSRSHIARYLLRAMEEQDKNESNPELVPNDDEEAVNLEHILPEHPSSDWGVSQDHARAVYKRIGNIVLLKAEANSRLGNLPFKDKRQILGSSRFALTKVAARPDSWGEREIDERQAELAKIAVKTWPLDLR